MIVGENNLLLQLGIIVIIASLAAFIFRLLKQPSLLAYILVGVIIGPVLKLITSTSMIESMSAIGIAFLLFIVGMEMDIKKLKTVSLVSTVGGIIQILILFILGFLVALLAGFIGLEAAYIGLMIAFSSTMVVMKILSDNKELNTLHGRIVLGILLVEDVIAIFALSLMTSINDFNLAIFGLALLKFGFMFGLAYTASKFLFPRIFHYASKSPEQLLLIASLAVCFIFSLAFYYLGFSIAIGAFIAGVALGNQECNLEIISKIKSLRDFFSLIFFVSLGLALSLSALKKMWLILIILIVIVILFKPILNMLICSLFKYTKKPAFLSAISLTQVGEFSLILVAQGLALGHVSRELFSLAVMLALVTMTLTTYFIKYDLQVYRLLRKPLKIFDRFTTEGLEYLPKEAKPKIVLCGHNRIGYSVLQKFKAVKKEILVVDYNPEIIDMLVRQGYHCIYGDVTDEEIIEKMNLRQIQLLVSTVPELKDSLLLIRKARKASRKMTVIVTASEIDEALKLYQAGADYVILPHFLGGEHVANLIDLHQKGKIRLEEERKDHLKHLMERKGMGHEHPGHSH